MSDDCPVFGGQAKREEVSNRLTVLENDYREIKECQKSIAESLRKLTEVAQLLEAHHAQTREGLDRAFSEIKEIKESVKDAPRWSDAAKNQALLVRIVIGSVVVALLGMIITN